MTEERSQVGYRRCRGLGSALGELRQDDESCSPARASVVEVRDLVDDIRVGIMADVLHAVIVMDASSDISWIFALGASFT